MMISTRGRYALRVMVDLAEHATGAYTPLKEVAERQDISQKYLESIMSNAKPCAMSPHCRTLPMWNRLNHVINEFFDSYTIADLMQTEDGGDYVI